MRSLLCRKWSREKGVIRISVGGIWWIETKTRVCFGSWETKEKYTERKNHWNKLFVEKLHFQSQEHIWNVYLCKSFTPFNVRVIRYEFELFGYNLMLYVVLKRSKFSRQCFFYELSLYIGTRETSIYLHTYCSNNTALQTHKWKGEI
jgi:hypothetical protein